MALQFDYVSRKARFSTDPGRLDRKVSLLSPFQTRDAAGGVSVTWISMATVWASLRFENARRLFSAGEKRNEEHIVYRIRHRQAINETWRIQHGSNWFEITSIEPLGRNHLLDITVRGVDQDMANVISALILESGDEFTFEDSNLFALEGAN